MSRFRLFAPLAIVLLTLVGCPTEGEPPGPVWPDLTPGTLEAAAAHASLDLPVGTPLGGYTGRDRALGDEDGPDGRDSDYRTDFVPSGGWQTRVPIDVLWLSTGERDAVLVRIDLIYSFDGLTEAIGAALSDAVDRDLTDSIFTFTNHSHSSYGPFTKATMLFFGGDFYRQEIHDRIVEQTVAVALQAYGELEPAAIGIGIDEQFDPIGEDEIFRDRREENDDLPGVDGEPTGPGWKDARASMLRVDAVTGEPIAALFAYGIHGTVMGGDNPLISVEAPGHVPMLLNQRHGGPLWMHAQGAGGDVSPAGRFGDFARMEYIAEMAADRLLELYDSIELTSDPLILDPVQRYVRQGRGITVTRNGTVDLRYMPWDPAWEDGGYRPDMRVWDDNGEILSPIDEFWSQYGAALCGEREIDIAIFGLDVDLPMYSSCLDLDLGYALFSIAFKEYVESREDYPLPLPEARTALLGALGMHDVPVTRLGGATEVRDVVFAFAPGEPTTLWTQFLRHRARVEQGVEETILIGYSMDHEGYLLTVDDWLLAGYEPAITWWGPLQGEYLLERLLEVEALAISPVAEDPAYPDYPTETWYPDWQTPFVEPDATPDAGTTVGELPPHLYTFDGVMPTAPQPAPQVARLGGVATWTIIGNDPATAMVNVEVQRQADDDSWQTLETPAGNPISDALPDILVTYTPDPLTGTDQDVDPLREHRYVIEWQAVDIWPGLDGAPGLPLGMYRLVASGASRDPADGDYPYDTLEWEAQSDPFEVVPAELTVGSELDGASIVLTVSYAASARGWRLIHPISAPQTPTPLVEGPDGITVDGATPDAIEQVGDATLITVDVSGLPSGPHAVEIDDGWGNTALVEVTLP